MNSTGYYDLNADALAARYDGVDAANVHADWAPAHLREEPGFACDIGAGSGRDANWLAARGWEVVAVEPSALRDLAAERAHPGVVWMDDALPDLRALRALGRRFDLILLSAVWMHVAPKVRERAFRILSELLNPSGLLVISLRRGGDAAENAARGFHDTWAEEIIGCANRRAIALRSHSTQPDLTRPGIHWETLVFAMPDDGTGSLPLLRHVIVNDNKSATYKLGLLRTLVRLAETAPGLVIARTDDYVEIPFGAVGLYWLKQYLPLVLHHRLPQRPSGPGGYGWAKEAFYQLQDVSPSDLRLGARFDSDRAGPPHPRHKRRLREYPAYAGALHHVSRFRRPAVVRIRVFPERGRRRGPSSCRANTWRGSAASGYPRCCGRRSASSPAGWTRSS